MKPPSSIEFVYNCLFPLFKTYTGLPTFVNLEIVCLVIKLEIQLLTFGYLELLGTGLSLWIASKDPQT